MSTETDDLKRLTDGCPCSVPENHVHELSDIAPSPSPDRLREVIGDIGGYIDQRGQKWVNVSELLAALGEDAAATPSPSTDRLREAEERVQRWARLIVSYADLTHDVVQSGGDWRAIATEWSRVVDEARAAFAGETPTDA